ncbi:MAG: hypothetical protein KGJ11_00870 [Candidatus Omnitrophica bacterium]|nr:hypothetical protein [Candidatus Omnitrophota bacterium]
MMQTLQEKVDKKEEEFDGLVKGVDEWEFFNINKNLPFLQEKDFSHVSMNLLKKYGYFRNEKLRLTYFVDLLIQAHEIVKNAKMSFNSIPPFIYREIDIPDEKKGIILITPNINGKTTIKMPLDA